jgi:VWFA-related protein
MSRLLALASLALLVTSASGQTPSVVPSTTNHESSTTITKIVKDTRLVYVPVIVETKGGEAISGLRKEQFTIEQDGHQQNVAVFEEIAQTKGFEDRAPAIAPGLVENFALSDAQARRSIIFILDTLNTPFLVQNTAKKALIKFIKTSLPPDQPVALMVLSGNGLHQLHSLTSDPKLLLELVNRVDSHYNQGEKTTDPIALRTSTLNVGNTKAGEGSLPGDLETRSRVFEQYMDEIENSFTQRRAAETTIVALEQLAGCLAGIPGRKSVIWATGGFPFEPIDPRSFTGTDTSLRSAYYRAWNRLNDSNIAIYPVDVNGLVYSPPVMPRQRSAYNGVFGGSGQNPNAPAYDAHAQQQTTLLSFASATGGKAFLNNNDIAGSFARASAEASRYYLLGYYLRGGDNKPGWHKLKVRTDIKHVEVRAREGFFLTEGTPREKDRLEELRIALGSPADYTGVHFGIRLMPASDVHSVDNGKRAQHIHVSFPPGALEIDTQNGNKVGVEFVMIALVGDKTRGQNVGAFYLTLTPADLGKVNRTGMSFDELLEVPPGEFEIRAAIRDVNSGKLGTVRTRMVVQ